MATNERTGGLPPAAGTGSDPPVARPVFRHVSPDDTAVNAAATHRHEVARLAAEVAALRRELAYREARTDGIVDRYERVLDEAERDPEPERERGALARLADALR